MCLCWQFQLVIKISQTDLSRDSFIQSETQASCTISKARSLGSGALIMAHELGHNMGADHDGEGVNEDCDGGHQHQHGEDRGLAQCTWLKLFSDKVMILSWVHGWAREPQSGRPAVKGFKYSLEVKFIPNHWNLAFQVNCAFSRFAWWVSERLPTAEEESQQRSSRTQAIYDTGHRTQDTGNIWHRTQDTRYMQYMILLLNRPAS